jgi:hypothetical protein
MAKKMRTRLGQDGYNYPYTHEDLVFDDNNTSLSQKLEDKASTEFVNNMLNGLRLVQITKADYEALTEKDPSVLYIVIN